MTEGRLRPFVCYVDLVADLFHAGHVRFLGSARAAATERARPGQAVRLIAGVHNDDDVERYKRRPVLTMAERVLVVAACRYVDEVVPEAPLPVTEGFIREREIDLVVHGDDFDSAELERYYASAMRLGVFATVPYSARPTQDGPLSTRVILDRIQQRYGGLGERRGASAQ